jgi:hypothetical protein
MDYSDEQLMQRFRFGRETIDYLANELRGSLERPTAKRTALSVQHFIKSLKIPKEQSEAVNQRNTDNTKVKKTQLSTNHYTES